ncbi:carbonic anhydrase [Cellulomonas sp. KRMCY2]|uniref:carbonic anhydrase n=1 Tax=Cellulomonas sp. KRMCY2 TaxID=1304865 RepID=UPI00045E5A54|nr:carbonic anhydrase [Cellulomonas sp. KRMCY2]
MPNRPTPAQAWSALIEGNARFVRGEMEHPSQGVDHRAELSTEQNPFAVVFGCSDSRVAAEIIFDQGLGDLFVVRTAGHVVDTTVIGSIEYGVNILNAPLVIVLGHDSCGAVGAAAEALTTGRMPAGFVRAIVDRVIPSIVHLPRQAGADSADSADRADNADSADSAGGDPVDAGRPMLVPTAEILGREHVRHTVRMLQSYSAGLSDAVAQGRCAIVGLEYTLADGRVRLVESSGPLAL